MNMYSTLLGHNVLKRGYKLSTHFPFSLASSNQKKKNQAYSCPCWFTRVMDSWATPLRSTSPRRFWRAAACSRAVTSRRWVWVVEALRREWSIYTIHGLARTASRWWNVNVNMRWDGKDMSPAGGRGAEPAPNRRVRAWGPTGPFLSWSLPRRVHAATLPSESLLDTGKSSVANHERQVSGRTFSVSRSPSPVMLPFQFLWNERASQQRRAATQPRTVTSERWRQWPLADWPDTAERGAIASRWRGPVCFRRSRRRCLSVETARRAGHRPCFTGRNFFVYI